MDTMQDYLVCYDLVDGDYCEYYETAKDLAEEMENVKKTLEKWGGGHADILDEDGDFLEWVEVDGND